MDDMTGVNTSVAKIELDDLLCDNLCDIETLFEALTVASDSNYEFVFMSMLINNLRRKPECDMTELTHNILVQLGLMGEIALKL